MNKECMGAAARIWESARLRKGPGGPSCRQSQQQM